MIFGIGTDIVEVCRIQAMLEEHGDLFLNKIFSELELEESLRRNDRGQYFAGRWAAKEALAKALGCGFGKDCEWRDITIVNSGNGKPVLLLSGKALSTSQKMGMKNVHVSISHEKHYACASVVVEA
ncbi:MAG: holo-ACP synthase [Victivallales bacterium]|nr:holo-ACP synthase [Victivallales bacterium]